MPRKEAEMNDCKSCRNLYDSGKVLPKAVFIDGTRIKANANTKKQIKAQIPAVFKHYAQKLMKEVNADR